jgi:hypothetical protein
VVVVVVVVVIRLRIMVVMVLLAVFLTPEKRKRELPKRDYSPFFALEAY